MSDSHSRRNFLAAGITLPVAAKLPPSSSAPAAGAALRHRVLGRTGLKVTEVGCGSEAVSDASVLQHAADLGINFFDTARPYEGGANERALAAALGSRRKDVIVSSRSYGKDRKAIEDDLETSLKELRTGYLDIWYIGSKDKPSDVSDGMLEAQLAAQKAGKIRFRGFSTHRLSEMLPFILEKGRFDVVQTPYNFAMGSARDPMKMFATSLEESIDRLHQAGIGIVAMKVMAGGYRERDASDPLYSLYRKPGAHAAALRWALRNPRLSTTSVRMASHDFLEENIKAMERPFNDDDAKVLAAHLERISPVYCRMCGSCDNACPKGLPVADLVRFATYADGYGEYAMGYERFRRLPGEQRNVRCGACSACAVECPNGVRVRDRVTRAQELFC